MTIGYALAVDDNDKSTAETVNSSTSSETIPDNDNVRVSGYRYSSYCYITINNQINKINKYYKLYK